MKKYFSKIIVLTLAAGAWCCSSSVLAGNGYGFGSLSGGCSFWSTLFPISFNRTADGAAKSYSANIIWVSDDFIKGMDDYADFYSSSAWPSAIPKGDDQPVCAASACTVSPYNVVGTGLSAYNDIKKEFPNEKVKVKSFALLATSNGTWVDMPVRKYKLLRLEVFIPYTTWDMAAGDSAYSEPLYFEYRATGNGSEMQLKEWGSTAELKSNITLPDKFNPVLSSQIDVWFNFTDKKNIKAIYPTVKVRSLSDTQLARVPAACK